MSKELEKPEPVSEFAKDQLSQMGELIGTTPPGEGDEAPSTEEVVKGKEKAKEEAAKPIELPTTEEGKLKELEKPPVAVVKVKEEKPVEGEHIEPVKVAEEEAPPKEELDELKQLREANQALMAQINELATKYTELASGKPARFEPPSKIEPRPEEKPLAKVEAEKQPPAMIPFIKPGEEEDIILHPEKLNLTMNKVYAAAVEDVLVRIAPMVQATVTQSLNLNNAVTDFYTQNPDLSVHKSFVGLVANEISAGHPEWTWPKLFEEVAGEVRKRLRVGAPAKLQPAQPTVEQERKQKPAFAPGGGKRGSTRIQSGISQEIGEMINLR